ncbi:hypothetical protein ASC78_23865 [Variovorax sp. Root318D1]|uniref:DUF4214 domain-containing protein n=1 Tax=Variovorax sp. Root318D1 TaxID=1736513 RepID=UPI0006FB817C|nr:DUF4214 domain-containing protein [Variovorax sp. Root318D1]KQU88738.1 hypothetical protein ASC78_23865 [Variovorax sp. Root318D1]
MAILTGTENPDILTGTGEADTIHGLGGADIIYGRAGDDALYGDAGDDNLYGEDGNDVIDGGGGYDYISGGAGNDVLRSSAIGAANSAVIDGGDGDDIITGTAGQEALIGGAGNDTITALSSYGSVTGGPGADVLRSTGSFAINMMFVDYSNDPSGVRVDLISGTAIDGWGNVDSISGFRNISGSAYNDILLGNQSGASYISGAGGNDLIMGGGGNDTLYGGFGNDFVDGGDASRGSSTGSTGTVYRLYRAALNREPDLKGLEDWSRAVDFGRTPESVAADFLSSSEFQKTYGGLDNTAFVTLLYQNVLHRAPDANGLSNWVNSLDAGNSRASVLLGFSQSSEFKTTTAFEQGIFLTSYTNEHEGTVFRLYQAALGRAPDANGFNGWTKVLDDHRSTIVEVAQSFVNSSEFRTKYGNLDNTQFVTQLYANVLGRAPDAEGLAGWVGVLNAGSSRAQVLEGFAESGELRAKSISGFRTFKAQQSYGHDYIEGGPGNDVLVGGSGADTFNFNYFDPIFTGAGVPLSDHIYGFENIDTLRLGGYGFQTANDVFAAMQQHGSDVVLTLSPSNTVTIHNTTMGQVSQAGILLASF